MQETFDLLQKWGYVLLFVYSLGGGYVGLIAAGVMSALGEMNIFVAIPVAALGNIAGSSMLAYLARYQKRELMSYLSKHRRKIALSQVWLKRYGAWLIVFGKYLYGVKTIVPLAIGFSRFEFSRFMFINIFSCLLWAIIVGVLGYYASNAVMNLLDQYNAHSYIVPLVLFGLGLLLYVFISQASKRVSKNL